MAPEYIISLSVSVSALIVSVWTALRQDRRDRIQGTKIHEERAVVVKAMYKLMAEYKSACNTFLYQTNKEDYFKERGAASTLMMQIYKTKQDNLFLFPRKKQQLLHDGVEAMEKMHRWTMDLGMAHWTAIDRKADPKTDPSLLNVVAKMTKDQKKAQRVANRLHKYLSRLLGGDA